MAGFLVGGMILIFGSMGLIGGMAQPNGTAIIVGATMTLVGGALCGAMGLSRERNPGIQAARAEAWASLVARTWPEIDAALATRREPRLGAATDGSTEVRPHLKSFAKARWVAVRRPQFLAFFAFLVVTSSRNWDWRWAAAGLGVAAIILVAQLARERIRVDATTLTIQQLIRKRSFALKDLGAVVLASTSFIGQTRRQAILVGTDGQKLHSFPVEGLDETELRAALAAVGLTTCGRWQVVPASVAGY